MDPKKLIEIIGAKVKYRNQTLFENLNFEIKKGEHWAITGENGRSKMDLLKTLAGHTFVACGKVSHNYYDEYRKAHILADPLFSYHNLISVVEMKHNFKNLSNTNDLFYQQRYNSAYSENSVKVEDYLKNIVLSVSNVGFWDFNNVVEVFSLKSLLQKHIIKLSNGETKRLRIGAALLKNPVLLLLNNPFSGLDQEKRKAFNEIFNSIANSGVTIVMETERGDIPEVITHVAVLNKNDELLTYPKEIYNADIVEHTPPRQPDKNKLKQLLNTGQNNQFKLIVKMVNVNVSYGGEIILKNINWEIQPGQRWSLSGPNGSGKSTLLSLINGDNPQAYANDIVLFDRKRGSGESIWEIKKHIGFISPELFQYFPNHLSCLKVVESGFYDTFGLLPGSRKENRMIAETWMEILELSDLKEKLMCETTVSEQQLCLLARSLVKNPDLLILDEPCQGFNLHQQTHFRNIINSMASLSNLTMIYVTHYREQLPECITNSLFLE